MPRDRLARVHHQPSPADWADDDPMTLVEAIAVFFPHGPLTVASLRGEIAAGRLTPAVVRRKHYVTPALANSVTTPQNEEMGT